MPDREIHFFNMDCLLQHEGFHHYSSRRDEWTAQSMQDHPEKMWDWYLDRYRGKENMVKGEDSTTYIASAVAAERIAMQRKNIKLIFLLRQPSERTFSNYYHRLKSGRAIYGFEDSLRFGSHSILNRSMYLEQLGRYYAILPADRIKVILFEDLVSDTENTVREISSFIGIDFNRFPPDAFLTHANRTTLTTNVGLRIRRNYLVRGIINSRYSRSLPNRHPSSAIAKFLYAALRLADKAYYRMVSLVVKRKPEMSPATREFLDRYFHSRLEGIDELVGKDVLSRWFPGRE